MATMELKEEKKEENDDKLNLKAVKDKKVKAMLQQNHVLAREMRQRLHDRSEFMNTEQAGFLEVDSDNDRERTLKVKQEEIKSQLGV